MDINKEENFKKVRLFNAAKSSTPTTMAELQAQLRVIAKWVESNPVGELLRRLAESQACRAAPTMRA